MTLRGLQEELTGRYEPGEARAVVRLLLEEGFGLAYADFVCGEIEGLSLEQEQLLHDMMRRLVDGEPVQYVLGKADFFGRTFHVAPGVLIPRPETEVLCLHAIDFLRQNDSPTLPRIIDIGTGSGCIALTLWAELGGRADVEALDISAEALGIARRNAQTFGADIRFTQADILQPQTFDLRPTTYDLIISNPPYIGLAEAKDMEEHVLRHEPHQALFVPDDDVLLFYRAIATFAQSRLNPGGRMMFETNRLYANDIKEMLNKMGFEASVHKDQFGEWRIVNAECRIPNS